MTTAKTSGNLAKFLIYSLIGIIMFFVPITIAGKSTIPIDHIVGVIRKFPSFTDIYGLIIVVCGALLPFVTGTFKKSIANVIFSLLGLFGLVAAAMVYFGFGPQIIVDKETAPYIFRIIVIPVVIIVPIGSVFLSFIVSYGLMEYIGVLLEPIMRPIWRTPGRSAVDAVASFVGSYSLALLVTNRVYKEGLYTTKEAAIIATGFSTVSATFMIIVAKTLGLMDHWNLFFWATCVITFIVSAITARFYPLSRFPDTYYNNMEPAEATKKALLAPGESRFGKAYEVAMETVATAPSLKESVISNLKDGIRLSLNIGATIMGIGTLALIVANHTKFFDIVGYIFYPVLALLGVPEASLLAKGAAAGFAEMYIPAILSKESILLVKFVVAVVSISEILFLDGSIPCILATDIPLSMKDLIIIWIERVFLSFLFAIPLAYLLFG